jgi:ATP-dependent exoDNAse (exonuclease V) beta subunit
VHGALQRVDLGGGGALEELVADAAFEEGCAERSDEVRALVLSALAAPAVVAAAAAPRCWRELPVTVPVDGGVLEGIVDLCYVEGDRLVVVDYKTDKLASPDVVPAAARRYRPQAGAYALALRSALALPVDRIVLVFLAPPGGAVEYVIDDPDEAAAEAVAELATAMA